MIIFESASSLVSYINSFVGSRIICLELLHQSHDFLKHLFIPLRRIAFLVDEFFYCRATMSIPAVAEPCLIISYQQVHRMPIIPVHKANKVFFVEGSDAYSRLIVEVEDEVSILYD